MNIIFKKTFKVREEMVVPLNPLEFFRESGYLEKIQRQR